jgi:hypothetical protein
MSEVEHRMEQLPSERAHNGAGAAQRGDGDADAARAAKARRNAWLLAGFAAFVYLGYIAWMFFRAPGG